MSTSNFHYYNTLHAHEVNDEFDYNDAVENLRAALTTRFEHDFHELNESSDNELRNYPRRILGTIACQRFTSTFDDGSETDVSIAVLVTVSPGYYSGINFDYEFEIADDWETNTYTKLEEAPYVSDADLSPTNLVVRDTREIFDKLFTKLNVVGTFSNGETLYTQDN